MSNTLVVSNSTISQEKDGLSWQLGANNIIFDEPFADNDYVFEALGQGVTVTWDVNTKTPTGITITVSAATSTGWFRAVGNAAGFITTEFVSVNIGASGKINRGSIALQAGETTITFGVPFSDTNYNFIPNGKDVNVVEIAGSRTPSSVQVNASTEAPNFEWFAIGA